MKGMLWVMFAALLPGTVFGGGWVEGVPTYVQRSDLTGHHLIFIHTQAPVAQVAQCDSYAGVVVEDSNESAKAAFAFATAALLGGKTFRCYVNEQRCSAITGAVTTFQICSHYPTLVR